MSDAQVLDHPEEAIEATVQSAEAPAPGADELCSHCGAPQKDSKLGWCRNCGFVPRLGTFVELDPWDKEPDPEPAPQPKPGPAEWLKMVPPWGWKLAGVVAGVLLFSLIGRLITPPKSSVRMWWALAQLGVGFLAFVIGHLACYVHAVMETDKFNMLDIVLKPFAIWAVVLRDMPGTLRRFAVTIGGYTATVGATLIIGGIPYEKLWEAGPVAKAKTNLIQAITDAAHKADADQNGLDKAVEDFTGKAVDKAVEVATKVEKEPEDERKMAADCVIAGFIPAGDNDFSGLILVSQVDGKVQCVGVLQDEIPADVRAQLNRDLRKIERKKPFVSCSIGGATWVNPQYMIRVKFKDWTGSHWMLKPAYESTLAEISTR